MSKEPAPGVQRETGLARRLLRVINLTEAALWAEALAAALWPAFAVLCLGGTLALLGVFEALPGWAHVAALLALGVALLGALAWGVLSVRWPERAAAIARLDRTRPERPLATMTDRLAPTGGRENALARALWAEHRRRAEAAAEALRASPPDLRLAKRDRWALRLVAPVLLVAAFIGAGGAGPERLRTALDPSAAATDDRVALLADPAVDVWAVPPAHTGRDTLYLNRAVEPGAEVTLPEGTEITIRASGMAEAPALEAAPLEGAPAFVSLGGGLHEATGVLSASGRLLVGAADAPDADYRIAMTPDAPPEIGLTADPGPGANRMLEVPFAASDDYGVVAAWATIRLADPATERSEIEPIEFGLPLPIAGDARDVTDRAVQDLTEHPWAGAEVVLTLHAEDGAGQTAQSDPVTFKLPERRFTDPLARALAEQRRELLLDYGAAERVLDVVQAVTSFPGEVFDDHAGAFMGVRIALRRLAPAIVEEEVSGVADDVAEFLWRAALSLEAGDLASALERLREAEERLRSALESGTEQEIREAIDELRQAMNEYMQEMMRQALENPDAFEQADENSMPLDQQSMEEMLRRMQEMAESGLRDQARQMLDQLAQMMENLRMGQMQQGQGPGQQAMQQLQEMIQRQQRLADETFDELRQQRRQGQQGQGQQQGRPGEQGQQGQQGRQQGQGQAGRQGEGRQPGAQPGRPGEGGQRGGRHAENGRLAAEQEALRRAIEELADQLGGGEGMDGASRALDQAGRAMGEARDDLQRGETAPAVQDQLDALDSLNGAAEALAEALQNQGQGQTAAAGRQDGEGRAEDRRAIDPFERPAGSYGAIDGSSTEVPNQALIDRARELLEELRRRSSERNRPDLELRYLERLLEQF